MLPSATLLLFGGVGDIISCYGIARSGRQMMFGRRPSVGEQTRFLSAERREGKRVFRSRSTWVGNASNLIEMRDLKTGERMHTRSLCQQIAKQRIWEQEYLEEAVTDSIHQVSLHDSATSHPAAPPHLQPATAVARGSPAAGRITGDSSQWTLPNQRQNQCSGSPVSDVTGTPN